MEKFIIPFLVLFLTIISCNENIPDDVLSTIDAAGKNKKELLKVIDYYRQNSHDNLKLEATYYLIKNMKDLETLDSTSVSQNSVYFTTLEKKSLIRGHKLPSDSIYYFVDKINKGKHCVNPSTPTPKYLSDLNILSASSIIKNIELSFYAWRNFPWSKHIPFHDFCEYILPYRCSENYSLNAKSFFINKYKGILDTLKLEKNPFKVANIIIADIDSWFTEDPSFFSKYPYLDNSYFSDFLKGKIGSCVSTTEIKITALRSMGIPTAYDCILNWANSDSHHFWYKIIDAKYDTIFHKLSNVQKPINTQYIMTGSSYTIFPREEGVPSDVILYFNRTVAKVFRNTFEYSNVPDSHKNNTENIPSEFLNSRLKDITEQYVDCINLKYPINGDYDHEGTYCLLCYDNSDWTIQCTGRLVENGNFVIFDNIGKNIVYLPVIYYSGRYNYIDIPFLLDNNGRINKLYPQKQREAMTLHTKYPLRADIELWFSFMKGGKFKVANRKDLSDTLTIYKIDTLPFYQKTVKIDLRGKKYKYFIYDYSEVNNLLIKRYDTGEIKYCCPSECKFKIKKIFGNPGTYSHESKTVFDGDQSTYFEDNEKKKDRFIGIETEKPVTINKICYCGRNDDNGINNGEFYKLYVWENGWKYIAKKKGGSNSTVTFDSVPVNALFLLKNSKGGTENRIFTYRNGKQWFW